MTFRRSEEIWRAASESSPRHAPDRQVPAAPGEGKNVNNAAKLDSKGAKVAHALNQAKSRTALCGTVAPVGRTWIPAQEVTCAGCLRKLAEGGRGTG